MALETKYQPAFFLEENFIDKDTGLPLANGEVRFYRDKERATLKNIYTISGSPPNYGYITINNPYTLNGAGSFKDDIPYLLPNMSPTDGTIDLYYIEIYNSSGVLQFVREAVPNIGETQVESVNDDNFILNSQFRLFNSNNTTLDLTTTDLTKVALLWNFQKSNTTATDKITLTPFPTGLNLEGSPTYYMHFECTSPGNGESTKDFKYRFTDVNAFQNQIITFSLLGIANSTGNAAKIDVIFIQNFGTGGSATVSSSIGTLDVKNAFTKLSAPSFSVPTIDGKTIGTDTYVEIILRMPLDLASDIGFTNIQLNSADEIFEYKNLDYPRNTAESVGSLLPNPTDQDIYSQIRFDGDKFIFDHETGKVESFLFGDLPNGYLFMDGTTYVRTDKVASTQVKYDRLYQKWETDSQLNNGNAFGYGSDGFFPMIYNDNVVFNNTKTKTAITNWADSIPAPTGFTFAIVREGATIDETSTLTFGPRIIDNSEINEAFYFRVRNTDVGVTTDATTATIGGNLVITIVQQGTVSVSEVTDFRIEKLFNFLAQSTAAKYFTINSPTTSYYVWFKTAGIGSDPAPGGTGIQVNLTYNDSRFVIASKIKTALEAVVGTPFSVSYPVTIELINDLDGVVTDATQGTTKFTVKILFQGTVDRPETTHILPTAADLLTGGQYFTFVTTTITYYIWYKIDGVGGDPAPGGTGLLVELKSTDTQFLVALRTLQALNRTESTNITFLDASTLSGGEYFLAENSVDNFYVWYKKDGTGTDPAVGGKIGIEIDILAADTAAQVAEKTRKGVSSHFFVIPDARGYFFSNWNNGSTNELDAVIRLDRGDGTIGDVIGSFQDSDTGKHVHQPLQGGGIMGAQGGSGITSGGSGSTSSSTDVTGIADTKPQNIQLLYCIKY